MSHHASRPRLRLLSLNVNGLADAKKRREHFFRLHRAEGGRPLGRCQAASILTTIAFATLY